MDEFLPSCNFTWTKGLTFSLHSFPFFVFVLIGLIPLNIYFESCSKSSGPFSPCFDIFFRKDNHLVYVTFRVQWDVIIWLKQLVSGFLSKNVQSMLWKGMCWPAIITKQLLFSFNFQRFYTLLMVNLTHKTKWNKQFVSIRMHIILFLRKNSQTVMSITLGSA